MMVSVSQKFNLKAAILLSWVGMGVAMNANAQSLLLTNMNTSATLAPGSVLIATTSANTSHFHPIDLTNTSGTTKSFRVKRYDVLLHSAGNSTASAYFSFAGFNYGPNVQTSPATVTLNPGQNASSLPGPQHLTAGLDEISPIGYSQIKYTAYDAAQPADSVQITFNYNPPIGLSTAHSVMLKARFNCGLLESYVFLPQSTTLHLNLYDFRGTLIERRQVMGAKGMNTIRFSDKQFVAGIYLLHAETAFSGTVIKVMND